MARPELWCKYWECEEEGTAGEGIVGYLSTLTRFEKKGVERD